MRRTVGSFGFASVGQILSTRGLLRTMFAPLEMDMLRTVWRCMVLRKKMITMMTMEMEAMVPYYVNRHEVLVLLVIKIDCLLCGCMERERGGREDKQYNEGHCSMRY